MRDYEVDVKSKLTIENVPVNFSIGLGWFGFWIGTGIVGAAALIADALR